MEGSENDEVIGCPACGTLNEGATAAFRRLSDDLSHTERELLIARRTVSRLRGERAKTIEEDPLYADALEILELWRELISPRSKELNGPRVERVIARLRHGYTKDELLQVVRGYARYPIEVDGKLFRDAELLFRDAKHVDDGLERYRRSTGDAPTIVHWRTVQQHNRLTIMGFLNRLYGEPLKESGMAYWPCPRCELNVVEDELPLTMRVAPLGMSWLAECSRCGCSDIQVLQMAAAA